MDDDGWLYPHAVTVQTYQGEGGLGGTSYAAAVDVACSFEDTTENVVSPTGQTVTSSSRLVCPLDEASRFEAETRVTDPWGRVTTVIRRNRWTGGGFGPESCEVYLR